MSKEKKKLSKEENAGKCSDSMVGERDGQSDHLTGRFKILFSFPTRSWQLILEVFYMHETPIMSRLKRNVNYPRKLQSITIICKLPVQYGRALLSTVFLPLFLYLVTIVYTD